MSRLPAALRASEHPRRRGRRARGAVSRGHGLVSVPGGGRQARLAAAGWRGSRSRSRPTSRCGGCAAPIRRSATRSRPRRCSMRGRSRRRRGGRICAGMRRICASCARSCPRSTSRSRCAAERRDRGGARRRPDPPARRGAVRRRRRRCRSPASEIEALIVAEERAFRRAEACLPLRRATTRELQWLLRRAACRGVAEPVLDDHWEPSALIVRDRRRPARRMSRWAPIWRGTPTRRSSSRTARW